VRAKRAGLGIRDVDDELQIEVVGRPQLVVLEHEPAELGMTEHALA
jgi:hypothetical protein